MNNSQDSQSCGSTYLCIWSEPNNTKTNTGTKAKITLLPVQDMQNANYLVAWLAKKKPGGVLFMHPKGLIGGFNRGALFGDQSLRPTVPAREK